MKQKNKKLEQLKFFYLSAFILGFLIIAPTHIFPPPTFMYARFPRYLEMMRSFLGFSWPATFEIYHYALYALAIIGALNVMGIIFYPMLRRIAAASSLTGVIFTSLIVLFFFLQFINVNVLTAVIYGSYFTVLLIANILTFKILIKKQKEA